MPEEKIVSAEVEEVIGTFKDCITFAQLSSCLMEAIDLIHKRRQTPKIDNNYRDWLLLKKVLITSDRKKSQLVETFEQLAAKMDRGQFEEFLVQFSTDDIYKAKDFIPFDVLTAIVSKVGDFFRKDSDIPQGIFDVVETFYDLWDEKRHGPVC